MYHAVKRLRKMIPEAMKSGKDLELPCAAGKCRIFVNCDSEPGEISWCRLCEIR